MMRNLLRLSSSTPAGGAAGSFALLHRFSLASLLLAAVAAAPIAVYFHRHLEKPALLGILGLIILLFGLLFLIANRTAQGLRQIEERYALATQVASDGIWDWDPATGAFHYVSPRFLALLGYAAGHIDDIHMWGKLVHPDDAEQANRDLIAHLKGLTDHYENEFRVQGADGEYRWLAVLGIATRNASGRAVRMVGSLRDITEHKRAENALRESKARLAEAQRIAHIGHWDWNIAGNELAWSDEIYRIFGLAPEQFGATYEAFLESVHPDDRDGVTSAVDAALRERSPYDIDHRIVWPDGTLRWVHERAEVARDTTGRATRMLGTVQDITERKLADERIEHLATRDILTGLPNRVLLNDRLEHALASAQRNAAKVAVLFIDLDRFKTINDSLGHHAGDELLKQAAERLGACVRKGDTLSRLGGDEFVVALDGLRDAEDTTLVAEKILQALGRPYSIEGHTLNISCSVGISVYPNDGDDIKTLMRNADTAMYHAKEKGRNNYQFFSHDMNVRAVERLTLEGALRRALEREEFVLHYQPQADMKTGKVIGAEALIRWRHPEKGLIFPSTFIPVAEDSGLIAPIGEWVLATACAQGRAWTRDGHDGLRIAVNLSARQINRELAKAVGATVASNRFDPQRLELEITESLLMHNVEETIAALKDLNDLGAQISIDDFGTGYSSLSYLRRLPIDAVKIDRSFVRDLGSSRDAAAIVAAIIAMAKSLQIRVTAEGVESHDQLNILEMMRCDEYQGYLFGKPVPAAQFTTLFLAAGPAGAVFSER